MKFACFDINSSSYIFDYEDEYEGCGECFKTFSATELGLDCKQCKQKINGYFVIMKIDNSLYFVSCLGVVGKKNSKFQTKILSNIYLKSNKIFQKKSEENKTVESISLHNTKHFISDINSALSMIIKEKELLKKTASERMELIMNEIDSKKMELAISLQDIFRNAKHATLAYGVSDYFFKESKLRECDYSIQKIHGLVVSVFYLYENYFKEKNIKVSIVGDVRDIDVSVNYSSIKIALDQIFNNMLKYCKKNSAVHITFKKNDEKFIDIIFSMESVCVADNEQREIFKIGVRGEKAKEYSSSGEGIGMAVIRKLIDLNCGEFIFEHGEVCGSVDSIPFCRNKYIMRLLLVT
ncbi:MAG: ATP-binding protein [Candidatus Paceibacterota bacterium]|jgi:signal transduction histidine kinase